MSGQSRSIHFHAAALLNAQCTFISFQLRKHGGKRDTIYKNNRAAMMVKRTSTTTTTNTSKSTMNWTKYIFERKEKKAAKKTSNNRFSIFIIFLCSLSHRKKQVWLLNTHIFIYYYAVIMAYVHERQAHTHITNSQKGRNYFDFECAFHVSIVIGFHSNPVRCRMLLPDTIDRTFCWFFVHCGMFVAFFFSAA